MGTITETKSPRSDCRDFNTTLIACGFKMQIATGDPGYAKRFLGTAPSGIHADLSCKPGSMPGHCPDECFVNQKPIVVFGPPQSKT